MGEGGGVKSKYLFKKMILLTEAVLGVTLEQEDFSITKEEGKTGNIFCKVTGLYSNNYVHWYQKKEGEEVLKRILYIKSGSREPVHDANYAGAEEFKVRTQSDHYNLKIQILKKSHSGVYYCASWDTSSVCIETLMLHNHNSNFTGV